MKDEITDPHPTMSEGERQITLAYVRGFGGLAAMREWSPEKHMAGLKEVFRAGADAGRRQASAVVSR